MSEPTDKQVQEFVDQQRFDAHIFLKRCSSDLDFGMALGKLIDESFRAGWKASK
jgi:hypothetical protein